MFKSLIVSSLLASASVSPSLIEQPSNFAHNVTTNKIADLLPLSYQPRIGLNLLATFNPYDYDALSPYDLNQYWIQCGYIFDYTFSDTYTTTSFASSIYESLTITTYIHYISSWTARSSWYWSRTMGNTYTDIIAQSNAQISPCVVFDTFVTFNRSGQTFYPYEHNAILTAHNSHGLEFALDRKEFNDDALAMSDFSNWTMTQTTPFIPFSSLSREVYSDSLVIDYQYTLSDNTTYTYSVDLSEPRFRDLYNNVPTAPNYYVAFVSNQPQNDWSSEVVKYIGEDLSKIQSTAEFIRINTLENVSPDADMSTNGVFAWVSKAFESVGSFFSINLGMGLTLGVLFAIPLCVTLLIFLVKALGK